MGLMARDVLLCALALLQLLCAAHCYRGDPIHGGRRQLELPKHPDLSTSAPNNTNVLRGSLIHRDFLETNTSTRDSRGRLLEAVQRSRRRAAQLSQASLSSTLSNYPSRGEYVMQISFGTPPVPFTAEADTGSDLIWLHCSACVTGNCSVFDPTASSTYQPAPCTDLACQDLGSTEACSSDGTTCEFSNYAYGDQSSTSGDLAFDTVTLDSAVPSIAFGCGTDVTGFDNVDGLVGLGLGPLSLPSQLGADGVVDQVFSYCLVDVAAASQGISSQLTFGAAAENSAATFTPLISNPASPTFYYVGVTGVSVGGTDLAIDPSAFQIDAMGNGGVILDSGTTVTMWTGDVFTAISNAFQSQITYPIATPPQGWPTDLLCYDISGVSDPSTLSFPSVVVHMTNVDLETDGATVFEQIETGVACLIMSTTTQTLSIIGNVQQRDHLIVYDVVNQQVGFQAMDCGSL